MCSNSIVVVVATTVMCSMHINIDVCVIVMDGNTRSPCA